MQCILQWHPQLGITTCPSSCKHVQQDCQSVCHSCNVHAAHVMGVAVHVPKASRCNTASARDPASMHAAVSQPQPTPGSLLTLQGAGAYDAAVHCASVSAARRMEQQRHSPGLGDANYPIFQASDANRSSRDLSSGALQAPLMTSSLIPACFQAGHATRVSCKLRSGILQAPMMTSTLVPACFQANDADTYSGQDHAAASSSGAMHPSHCCSGIQLVAYPVLSIACQERTLISVFWLVDHSFSRA